VDCAGLAYRIQIPLSTYERLPSAGDEVTLLLHLAVREDEWRLFGFGTTGERDGFRALVRVNGVGPVLALSVLSGFAADSLSAAVAGGDIAALTRVKGVGRKPAERIVMELRDVWADRVAGRVASATDAAPIAEALRALEALGQDPAQARRKVERAVKTLGADADVAALVRAALRN
jgi:Holliday junction DNA helicase RuvA